MSFSPFEDRLRELSTRQEDTLESPPPDYFFALNFLSSLSRLWGKGTFLRAGDLFLCPFQ